MKTWIFWVLVASMTARVTCYSAATVHFIPLMVWKGLSEGAAASLLGVFALVNLADALCARLDRRSGEQTQAFGPLPLAACSFSAAALVRVGLLAALVFYDRVYFTRCLIPHRLGNGRRFFRPPPFRDHQGNDEFLLYVGELCRSRPRRDCFRPYPQLCHSIMDLFGYADSCNADGLVADPTMGETHEIDR